MLVYRTEDSSWIAIQGAAFLRLFADICRIYLALSPERHLHHQAISLWPGLVSRNDRYLSRRKRDRRRLIAGFWCRCGRVTSPLLNERSLDRDRDPLAFHRATRFSSSSLLLFHLQPRRRYAFYVQELVVGHAISNVTRYNSPVRALCSLYAPSGSGWFTGSSIASTVIEIDARWIRRDNGIRFMRQSLLFSSIFVSMSGVWRGVCKILLRASMYVCMYVCMETELRVFVKIFNSLYIVYNILYNIHCICI